MASDSIARLRVVAVISRTPAFSSARLSCVTVISWPFTVATTCEPRAPELEPHDSSAGMSSNTTGNASGG